MVRTAPVEGQWADKCGNGDLFTTGNPFACELSIVMSPSWGEGLFLGVYCLTCIRHAGSFGEALMKPSRICWQGTMCSLTIKFVLLILQAKNLPATDCSVNEVAIEDVKSVQAPTIYGWFYDVAWRARDRTKSLLKLVL